MAMTIIRKYADGTDSRWHDLVTEGGLSDLMVANKGHIYYRKIGVMCYVYIRGIGFKSDVTDGSAKTLATMPTGFRPAQSNVEGFFGFDYLVPGIGTVRTNGTVVWEKPDAYNSWSSDLYGYAIYPVD